MDHSLIPRRYRKRVPKNQPIMHPCNNQLAQYISCLGFAQQHMENADSTKETDELDTWTPEESCSTEYEALLSCESDFDSIDDRESMSPWESVALARFGPSVENVDLLADTGGDEHALALSGEGEELESDPLRILDDRLRKFRKQKLKHEEFDSILTLNQLEQQRMVSGWAEVGGTLISSGDERLDMPPLDQPMPRWDRPRPRTLQQTRMSRFVRGASVEDASGYGIDDEDIPKKAAKTGDVSLPSLSHAPPAENLAAAPLSRFHLSRLLRSSRHLRR